MRTTLAAATLTVNDTTATSLRHAPLSGAGTVDATIDTTSLVYRALLPTDVQIKTVTVTNEWDHTLSLSDSIGGADPADFTILGGCGPTRAPNSSCPIALALRARSHAGAREPHVVRTRRISGNRDGQRRAARTNLGRAHPMTKSSGRIDRSGGFNFTFAKRPRPDQ